MWQFLSPWPGSRFFFVNQRSEPASPLYSKKRVNVTIPAAMAWIMTFFVCQRSEPAPLSIVRKESKWKFRCRHGLDQDFFLLALWTGSPLYTRKEINVPFPAAFLIFISAVNRNRGKGGLSWRSWFLLAQWTGLPVYKRKIIRVYKKNPKNIIFLQLTILTHKPIYARQCCISRKLWFTCEITPHDQRAHDAIIILYCTYIVHIVPRYIFHDNHGSCAYNHTSWPWCDMALDCIFHVNIAP
jgi:hypothetical protein